VTTFSCTPPLGRIPRLAGLLAATLSAVSLTLAILSAPAGAVVTEVSSEKVGVQPREMSRYYEGTVKWVGQGSNEPEPHPEAKSFSNHEGNSVLHSAKTYVIYWDPQHFYHGDWKRLIDGFMQHMGTASAQPETVFAVDGQYHDATNQPATDHFTFMGALDDTNPYPTSPSCTNPAPFETGAPLVEGTSVCLTDAQVRGELETFRGQHTLPRGMGTIYYVLTPPGVAVCLDGGGPTGHCSDFAGTLAQVETAEEKKEALPASYTNSFCSYHNAIGNGNNDTILYAVIPWTAGGDGDYHLFAKDRTGGSDCQDGGFEPSKHPTGELQEKEREKPPTPQEEEEFEKLNAEEKRKVTEAKELGLEKPHDQQPNQLGGKRSEDGTFDTGLADLIINQIGVEQQNTVTDPLLNAWHDSAGNELTDECRNSFFRADGNGKAIPETMAGSLFNQVYAGKNYYINDAFNAASLKNGYSVACMKAPGLEPHFTAPNPVNAGEIVGLDGNESDITLNWAPTFAGGIEGSTYPVFTWNFGDGTPPVTGFAPATAAINEGTAPCSLPWLTPCAGSVFHSYQYGGTYNASLTVVDVGGNTATYVEQITVAGPPPPGKESTSGGNGSTGGSTGSTSTGTGAGAAGSSGSAGSGGTGGATGGKPPVPAPVAAAAAASRSLRRSLRSGLVIRYSVNEQVAGHFEVLLGRTLARHLGIGGAPALGLPAGTPPQVMIGKAVLVTTAAGRSSITIHFSPRTAARLAHVKSVTVMIRLVVRNAATRPPATTTVLSKVTLTH
jgi:hypothetical protein